MLHLIQNVFLICCCSKKMMFSRQSRFSTHKILPSSLNTLSTHKVILFFGSP